MRYGLIGERLGHSFSPELHKIIGGYDYELCELAPDALANFLAARNFDGVNVTIPYKASVMPYLDGIDPAAQAIGAVNTICKKDGKLYGYNTDFFGLSALLSRIGVPLVGRKVLILGSGGTSHTARAVATSLGAAEIVVLGRVARGDVISYEDGYRAHSDADFIINTTPVGMFPHEDAIPIDLARFPKLQGVADVVYNPLTTELVRAARARGIPAEGGLYMLVAQAVAAARLFTGKRYNTRTIERAYRSIRRTKETIWLVGMPGAGKTTVGKALAALLDRPFYDTDAELVRTAGRDIPAIFAQDGENSFREMETETLLRLAATTRGAVIATGGGIVLRDQNIAAMQRNGRIWFLDRPLEDIKPTDDRPLSRDRAALHARYTERLPRYLAAADQRVPVTEGVAATARAIRKEFEA